VLCPFLPRQGVPNEPVLTSSPWTPDVPGAQDSRPNARLPPEVVVGIVGILVGAFWQPAFKPILKCLLRRAGVLREPDSVQGVFELPVYHPIPQLAPVQHPGRRRHPETLAELPG